MANNRIYPVNHHTASELIDYMHDYLSDGQGMQTQRIIDSEGGYTIIQARTKGGAFKQIVGLDKAVTLRFIEAPNSVSVEVGEAKWIDKSVVMTISMFVLWPLAVTSGVGIYKQKKLISNLISEMDSYMVNMPVKRKSGAVAEAFETIGEKVNDICNSNEVQKLAIKSEKLIYKFIR